MVLALLDYPPVRYFIFAIVPMMLFAATAMGHGALARVSQSGQDLARSTHFHQQVFQVLLFVPLAVLSVPAALWILSQFDVGLDSMSRRIALIAVLLFGLCAAGRKFIVGPTGRRCAIIFSVSGLLVCAAVAVVSPEYRFWSAAQSDMVLWVCSIVLASLAAMWDALGHKPAGLAWTSGAWIALVSVVLVGDLRPLIRPHFTLNEIAADITRRVPQDSKLLVLKAASPLLPTKLRYRDGTDSLGDSDYLLALSCLADTCGVQPPAGVVDQFDTVATYAVAGSYLGRPAGVRLILMRRRID